jgi:integrase
MARQGDGDSPEGGEFSQHLRLDGQAPGWVDKAFRYALRRADVTNFRFHDLRHTAASWLAMSGASLVEIAEVLGHRSLAVTKKYVHLMPSHTRGVVERMTGQFLP